MTEAGISGTALAGIAEAAHPITRQWPDSVSMGM